MQEEFDGGGVTIPVAMTMAQRIRAAWNRVSAEYDHNQAELARRMGVSRATISNWFGGGVASLRGANLLKLAACLRVNPQWLETGYGPERVDALSDIPQATQAIRSVPIITWEQAAMGAVEGVRVASTESVLVAEAVGPKSFALRQQGSSMEPRIPDGALVIIDPDVQVSHGDVILAKRPQDVHVLLRQLWFDGGQASLRAFQAGYPAIEVTPETIFMGRAVSFSQRL